MYVGISLRAHGRYSANCFRSSSHLIKLLGWNQYKLFILVISNFYMNKYNTRTIGTTICIVITTLIFLHRTRCTMYVSLVGCWTVKENFHYLRIHSVSIRDIKDTYFSIQLKSCKAQLSWLAMIVRSKVLSKSWSECREQTTDPFSTLHSEHGFMLNSPRNIYGIN